MDRKNNNIIRNLLTVFVCFLLLSIKGCSPFQSPNIKYVDGYTVELMLPDGFPSDHRPRPDTWRVKDDDIGSEIWGTSFGFEVQLTESYGGNDYRCKQASILVKMEVVGHWADTGIGDIWEKAGPDGSFGFVKAFPEEGTRGSRGDDVFYAQTNGEGKVFWYVGLGHEESQFDPDIPPDYGYEWPGNSSGEMVDTVVQLKITIPGKEPPLPERYVWVWFVRATFQGFWAMPGGDPPGVYHISTQGIGDLTKGLSMPAQIQPGESTTTEHPILPQKVPGEKITSRIAAKERAFDNPPDRSKVKGITTMDYTSDGPSLDWAHWYQLRWDPYYGEWYWDDPCEMHALWVVDPNDPNEMIQKMDVSEPYVVWADVNLPEPFDGNDAKSTVVLRSIDKTTGEIFSKMRMYMYLYSKSPDNKVLTMLSDYVVVMESPEEQGYYQDSWGNVYVAIYAPEGSVLDVDFPATFGDFNADDEVDYLDLALFVEHWLDSANDVNTTYDAMYEEPNNWSGSIDFRDFSAFAGNWQPAWTQGMMMGQSMSQSLDFTEDIYPSAPAEQPEPEPQPQATEVDIQRLVQWLEELWLSGELNGHITEDEYLEFRKAIQESF